ncbi:MAG: hypothetical protein ACYC6R_09795 [Anaerolineales bacterium]
MRRFLSLCLFPILLAACAPKAISTPTPSVEINPAPVFTPIPSLTPTPTPTATPYASLGTIALDFISLLCNTEWMNGAQHLTTCPDANADHSGGFATPIDPIPEGLPANTPVMLTIPPGTAMEHYSFVIPLSPSAQTTAFAPHFNAVCPRPVMFNLPLSIMTAKANITVHLWIGII